jgi:protein SCO1/2
MNRRRLCASAAFGAMFAAAFFINAQRGCAAQWGASYFPNVPLVTQDGQTVHFYDDLLKGKRVIVNFIYTTCGDSCPLETARLAQVKKILGDHMGRDIFFYSLTVDPEHDTPAELKKYSDTFHTGPGWLFLTGKKEDLELIRRKFGQAVTPGQNQITDHSTSIMIGNEATGEWIRDGSTDNPQYIATIVRDWFAGSKRRENAGSYANAPALPAYVADRGGYLFHNQCSACHTIGLGDTIGPDLLGVTKHRDAAWLAGFIAKPDAMLLKKDPVATALYAKYKQVKMPNLRLNDVDVKAILGYLEAQTMATATPAAALAP